MQFTRIIIILSLLLLSTTAISANDLLNNLTSQLGITNEQAAGGAGAMFNLAKSRLSSEDFAPIAAAVPDLDSLMAAAPSVTETATGKMANMLGGENGLGSLATLASSFTQLGLSSDMISQFTPIVLDYLQQVGGTSVMDVMKGALAL
jgi:hypothetical protein